MSKTWSCVLSLMAALTAAGCTPTIQRAELDQRIQKSYARSFPDKLYYTGSDDSYDYYVIENELSAGQSTVNRPQTYKVRRSESVEDPRTPVTEDRSKWRFAGPSKKINDYLLKHADQPQPPPASQPDISKFHF